MQPYGGLGLWVWEADKVNPDSICAMVVPLGFRWIAVKAHDGLSSFNSSQSIQAWKQACLHHKLNFGIWGYLSSPGINDARGAIQACHAYGPSFYIADVETEYEHASGPVSQGFCKAFRDTYPHLPAAISSFGRVDLHSGIAFKEWKNAGFDFMPQAYECESAELSPALCVNHAKTIWPQTEIYPTLGTYTGARGILTGQQLYDSVSDIQLPGVNVWDAQELHPGQLAPLKNLNHNRSTESPSKPQLVKKPIWNGKDPFRTLALTSPPMKGLDVKHAQQAIDDRTGWRHETPLKVDGVYAAETDHRFRRTMYELGILDTRPTLPNQILLEQPWKRTPVEVQRDKQRRAQSTKHGGITGLKAMPALASHYDGVHENPAGSNTGSPFPTGFEEKFGVNGVAWCGCFAGYIILLAGGHVTPAVMSCPAIKANAMGRINGFDSWIPNHQDIKGDPAGWLVLFNFDGGSTPEHVGIVESFSADYLTTWEGNTGGPNPANGGMVAHERRPYAYTLGYARPKIAPAAA